MIDSASLASDLEALMLRDLTEEDFRRRYRSGFTSIVLDAIWHNLEHYLADADIRAKDVKYRAMQDREMLKLIQLLRDDAPMAELQRVNFLSPA
jgi:hypothetical protein